MDILSQSSLLVGVTSFALGTSVFTRNVRNKLFLSFLILTTVISTWAIFFFLFKIWGVESFYRLHLLMNLWIGPAGMNFIQVMIRIRDRFSRNLFLFSVGLATLFSGLILFVYTGTSVLSIAPWLLQAAYFLPVLLVLQILNLLRGLFPRFGPAVASGTNSVGSTIGAPLSSSGTQPFKKTPMIDLGRRSLIYGGGLLVLLTSVMDHVPWIGPVVPCIGNLALTIYLFFISQAISHQRLLNFGAVVSRFLVILAVAFTITILYWVLFAWIQNNTALFFLNSFIMSFVLIMLLEPIRSLVSYLTDQLLTQKHLQLKVMLKEAQRGLFVILDPNHLFQAIMKTVEQTLHPKWAALFILGKEGTKFRRVRTSGISQNPSLSIKEILANHLLVEYCQKLKRRGDLPILLDQILENEIDRSASSTQREYFSLLNQGLKAMGCNLLIPLMDSENILGFISLYVPSPPEPWGNNWGLLQILYPYFEQASKSLKNMDIFVRQREKERLATLGTIAAGLAHEIRNPLGAIKGAAQFLDPESGRPESKFLRIIIDETDRLNRVVCQFLDYSKPTQIDFEKIEINQLISKTIDNLKPSVPNSVQLIFESGVKIIEIQGSSEQMKQVMINLIQNAVKALQWKDPENIPEGWIRVSANLNQFSEVVLSIEDNGVGIKKENLEKLFIPFFTTSPQGTGLGLSICQKIIEAHRGRIEVNSEEGRGARFSVIIPNSSEVGPSSLNIQNTMPNMVTAVSFAFGLTFFQLLIRLR